MAACLRSVARPALSFSRFASKKPSRPTLPNPLPLSPSRSFQRVPRELGSLLSLLPFHSAVSSARLTSRLGADSARMCFGTLCSSDPGV